MTDIKLNSVEISPELAAKLELLKKNLTEMGSVLVAFSAGVDSTYLLSVAAEVLKEKAVAVTAHSELQPSGELELSKELAALFGVRHIIIETNELENEDFASNPTNRCFYCKSELYTRLIGVKDELGAKYVLDGSNLDDIEDYRPGLKAARELGVISPLKEVGLTKDEIRILSRAAGIKTWDQPSSPCLASRIPYGMPITAEKLSRIDKAENIIRQYGPNELRVRDHDQIARIEVPRRHFELFIDEIKRVEIIDKIKSLGYKYVALDLEGYRSGSLNEALDETD